MLHSAMSACGHGFRSCRLRHGTGKSETPPSKHLGCNSPLAAAPEPPTCVVEHKVRLWQLGCCSAQSALDCLQVLLIPCAAAIGERIAQHEGCTHTEIRWKCCRARGLVEEAQQPSLACCSQLLLLQPVREGQDGTRSAPGEQPSTLTK